MPPVPVRDILLAASLLGWYPEPPVPGLPALEGVLMARICARCRLPLDGDPRDHDCPEDDSPQDPAGDDGTGDEAT